MNTNKLLYEKIKRRILKFIKSLERNQRIPSRIELAKEYGVTRTTIERAVSELIGEGFLYTKDGSGTYVSDLYKKETKKLNNVDQWGVVIPNIMHDTYPEILRGVEDVASDNKINTLVCNTDNNPQKQKQYINNLIDTGINGIIIVPSIIEDGDTSVFCKLQNKAIPFIACNRGIPGIQSPKVVSNNFYGGYMATKHLIEQGYKRIAFIANIYYLVSVERYQGYITALTEAGIKINEEYVIFEEYSSLFIDLNKVKKIGYKKVKELLNSPDKPDAFFCFDDMIAQGAYYAITEKGFNVGRDIGLVGYNNNYYICKSLPGKLTSVDFNSYKVGNQAAMLLLNILHGEKMKKNITIIIQPNLKVRGSSKKMSIPKVVGYNKKIPKGGYKMDKKL